MSAPSNPPAFPVAPGDVPYWEPGMSLRDWFAGRAIARCISNALDVDGTWDPGNAAYHAYLVADAMLAAREQGA